MLDCLCLDLFGGFFPLLLDLFAFFSAFFLAKPSFSFCLFSLFCFLFSFPLVVVSFSSRPQGIMLQILLIMLFQISPKNPSLCSLLFFLCSSLLLLFHKIVQIVNVMHKLHCSITSYNIQCITSYNIQFITSYVV